MNTQNTIFQPVGEMLESLPIPIYRGQEGMVYLNSANGGTGHQTISGVNIRVDVFASGPDLIIEFCKGPSKEDVQTYVIRGDDVASKLIDKFKLSKWCNNKE